MPQVQVLPAIPTFGNRLAEALGNAGANISRGYNQRKAQSDLEKLFSNSGLQANQNAASEDMSQPVNSRGITPQNNPSPLANVIDPLNLPRIHKLASQAYGEKGADIILEQLSNKQKLQGKEEAQIRKEQREESRKEQDKIDKLQTDIVQGNDSAEVSEANLNRMEALIDSDELISPLGAYLTNLLGAPVSLTSNASTEEFQKLASQRGLNVASAYGFGRILQTEFENFLQTIPSLLNSREGKERIVSTLRYFDNLAKSRYEIYKELLPQHRGRARELELNISEAMKPRYNKFGEVLKYGDELVDVISPTGQKGKIPRNQVEEAFSEGYKPVGAQ